jgi:hypothetical protein
MEYAFSAYRKTDKKVAVLGGSGLCYKNAIMAGADAF